MTATDNLTSLHKYEEELRAKSLTALEADPTLSDHWNLVGEAMNAIYAFAHDHPHGSENELTLQYLGIRLFNAAGASTKLALSGYYQKAFDQVRDLIETYFLVDYLSTYPDKIEEWKLAEALPGGRQYMVVEISRHESPGGTDVGHIATWRRYRSA